MPLALAASPARAASPLADVLQRAGARVEALESELAVTVAVEEYRQTLRTAGDAWNTTGVRDLSSEVVWVPTGDALVWAFFRDVTREDGRPVEGRASRLEPLFAAGATPDARLQASRILEESARRNIGPPRTVNSPTVALTFLHPRNQPRFRFELRGSETRDGVPLARLRFSETARSTLIRSADGKPIPARGTLWLRGEDGALVESELDLEAPGVGPVQIAVRYAWQPRLSAWLPLEMRETYGRPQKAGYLQTRATYHDYRKAEVEVQEIRPVGPGTRR